jgi:RNA polymerase sigma-70 factor (ECF subfamily)
VTGPEAPAGSPRFATTRWSIVVAAGAGEDTAGRAALESLCTAYWYPLYAFERRGGTPAADAQDLVQGFFAELLEKDYLRQADRERGRFRTFLLAAFRHFASKAREKARALKRGGGRKALPLDFEDGENRYLHEPADERTPERIWALTLLDETLDRLRTEHDVAGRADLFEALRGTLGSAGAAAEPYAALGARLAMSEGAVKVAVHRLRKRYREVLRALIAETVAEPADVDDEIRHLLDALAG